MAGDGSQYILHQDNQLVRQSEFIWGNGYQFVDSSNVTALVEADVDGSVYCIDHGIASDPSDGRLVRWTSGGTPNVNEDTSNVTALVEAGDGSVYCIDHGIASDPSDGRLVRWTSGGTPNVNEDTSNVTALVEAGDGSVYSIDHGIASDPSDGRLVRWTSGGTPNVNEDTSNVTALVEAGDGSVYCIDHGIASDPSDGRLVRWTSGGTPNVNEDTSNVTALVEAGDGSVYSIDHGIASDVNEDTSNVTALVASGLDGSVYCIDHRIAGDSADGRLVRWTTGGTPNVNEDTSNVTALVVSGLDGSVYCIDHGIAGDSADGRLVRWTTGGTPNVNEDTSNVTALVVSGLDGSVYCIDHGIAGDSADGRLVRWTTGGTPNVNEDTSNVTALVVSGLDGSVYCIDHGITGDSSDGRLLRWTTGGNQKIDDTSNVSTLNAVSNGPVLAIDHAGGTARLLSWRDDTATVIGSQLIGKIVGTTGSYGNSGNTAAKAFDGDLATFFDGPTANGNWVGLDLGSAKVVTSIAYASRGGWGSRMNGGIFQASNSSTFATGVVNLYTIPANANPSSTSLTTQAITNANGYRYVRYLSPANSFGDVAEVQFFGKAYAGITQLVGTVIGTTGSFQNDGNSVAKAVDRNLSTFFDAPTANGNWVGLDLGSAQAIKQISYAPRAGFASRMIGGIFQVSTTANFSTGVVNLHTISSAPVAGSLITISLNVAGSYRYVRYLSPNGSYGDISEFQVFG